MSFWDNVKKFAQPYSDEDYDDYDDEELDAFEEEEVEMEQPRSTRRSAFASESAKDYSSNTASSSTMSGSSAFSGQVLSVGGNKQEVVLFHAKTFDDAARASDELRSRKAVILNMENVDKALTRRVVDFLSGCVYALDGKVKKIAQSTYLFCPHSMDIVGDLEQFQSDVEAYI